MLQKAEKPSKNGAVVVKDTVGTNLGLGKKDKCNSFNLAVLKGTCTGSEGSTFVLLAHVLALTWCQFEGFFKVAIFLHGLKSV